MLYTIYITVPTKHTLYFVCLDVNMLIIFNGNYFRLIISSTHLTELAVVLLIKLQRLGYVLFVAKLIHKN